MGRTKLKKITKFKSEQILKWSKDKKGEKVGDDILIKNLRTSSRGLNLNNKSC